MFMRLLFFFLIISQFALGHELKPAVANLELIPQSTSTNFVLKIQLNLESIIAGIEPNHENTKQSANSDKYDQLRKLTADQLNEEFQSMKQVFLSNISFLHQDGRVKFVNEAVNIKPVGDLNLTRETEVVLTGSFPSTNNKLTFNWSPSYGAIILRVNQNNTDLFTKYLKTGDVGKFSTNSNNQDFLDVVKDYIIIGFQHIVPKGLDHILFVVGLFLLSTQLKPLIWQISAFTLAHTLTIFLGVLQFVKISPTIVEPIIAISISYIAIENIFFKELTKWRPVVVFVFGLLHGLGFAGILNEIGVAESYFITSLISFNVGVELGQLTVIAICFGLLGFWFRSKRWYRAYLTNPLSGLIAAIGFFWFIQRVAF